MIAVWRLVKDKHKDDAFDGEGAAKYAGRWNLPGVPMVYAAGSLSLAALELFVHLEPVSAPNIRFVSFRVEIPDDILVEKLALDKLPDDWRSEPASGSTQELGAKWARANRSAVLRVPSSVIPIEYNYCLNPGHQGFKRIRISEPVPFSFDARMWK